MAISAIAIYKTYLNSMP